MFNIETLRSKSAEDLTKILKDLNVKVARNSTENDKIFAILDYQASNPKVTNEYYNATETNPEANIPTEKQEETKPVAKKVAPKRKPKTEPKAEAVEEPKEIASTEKTETAEDKQEEPVSEEIAASPAKKNR